MGDFVASLNQRRYQPFTIFKLFSPTNLCSSDASTIKCVSKIGCQDIVVCEGDSEDRREGSAIACLLFTVTHITLVYTLYSSCPTRM